MREAAALVQLKVPPLPISLLDGLQPGLIGPPPGQEEPGQQDVVVEVVCGGGHTTVFRGERGQRSD